MVLRQTVINGNFNLTPMVGLLCASSKVQGFFMTFVQMQLAYQIAKLVAIAKLAGYL